MHVLEQGMQNKYCHILLMYQLLGAAHFTLWWFAFAKRQSPYLTSPLHLLILFWITLIVPQASEMCLTSTVTFVLYISLKQFQALLHPKATCGCGETFCFCYQFICQLFFFLVFTSFSSLWACSIYLFQTGLFINGSLSIRTQHFSFQVCFKMN